MEDVKTNPFLNGNAWIRADFHLHTKADKEFKYNGEDNSFVTDYVDKLNSERIKLGVITNHNKFVLDENQRGQILTSDFRLQTSELKLLKAA
ncbi:hypothetical protein [Pseudoalteromonas undina]|uniref:hypothetical protein n=1 Tax=Pseudoalteromonas undina TaxID=43660 RepID=UPI000A42D94B|nr:hypothetical protein [Pseudoalteromonas undina]